ncbi:MAG: nitroreductase family protein [Anaerolineae bacterium]|nr:nitroreductase family protein [Anaerolineae bacterium]
MDIWEGIRTKHSIRAFAQTPIAEGEARQILDAGRRAPSGFNAQPWYFIAVRDRAMLHELSTIGRSTRHVAGAALCVLILSPDRETNFWRNLFDAGQAATYLMLAAHELGIASCPGTVYEPVRARDLLGFPDDWKPYILISFGYPDPADPRLGTGKGGRKPFEEVVRWEKW